MALATAAGAFGFLIFNHVFDGPDLYGASSFFETMPSRRAAAALGIGITKEKSRRDPRLRLSVGLPIRDRGDWSRRVLTQRKPRLLRESVGTLRDTGSLK